MPNSGHPISSKYQPLSRHLRSHGEKRISMSFADIERIIGDHLPPSARRHRAWWSNNPSNSVITYAWLEAGYRSSEVSLEGEHLVFVRPNPAETQRPGSSRPEGGRHPLIGCMAGTITIHPGTDLTEPAEPDWEEQTLAKFDRLLGSKAG